MPLVINRKVDDSFCIITPDGVRLWVTLVEARGGRAKIVVDAPREYEVLREELLARREREGVNGREATDQAGARPRIANDGQDREVRDDDGELG